MSKEIVLDIETKESFADVGGYKHSKMSISVIGVYFYETDEYKAYLEDELHELWPKLEHADRIIGYNTLGFDYPVMNNYYAGDFGAFPSLDLLVEIRNNLGFRIKLDDVAQSTLGAGKSGHGLMAVQYFKEGKIDELCEYCLQDVKVTKEVYEYGLANGHILYDDRIEGKKTVPIDFSMHQEAAKPAVNLTIPF